MAPTLPCRTPIWSTSWLLPTSLPKYTKCHHAVTRQPPRPSSAAWSCHPSCPRRGSRSPWQRSRRRLRCLQVRLPMSLGPPGHISGSPGPAWWQRGCGAGPAPVPRRTRTQGGGSVLSGAVLPAVPWCRSTVPVPPDCERLADLTRDLAQQRQELVGDEETQVPLMEPIHFDKVPGPGGWPRSAPGVGGC